MSQRYVAPTAADDACAARAAQAAQKDGAQQAYEDAGSGLQDPAAYYGLTHAARSIVPSQYQEMAGEWARAYALTMKKIAGRRHRGEPDRGGDS